MVSCQEKLSRAFEVFESLHERRGYFFGEWFVILSDEEVKKLDRIILTDRDFEVLRFVLEMKFSTFDVLYERFFRKTISGSLTTSPEFMRRRLFALVKNGLLRKDPGWFNSEFLYVITEAGFRVLRDKFFTEIFARPYLEVHYANVPHDKLVERCRAEFERELLITKWVSEQNLKSSLAKNFKIMSDLTPDGVYHLPSGEVVAFELEIARKSWRRISQKLHKIDNAIDRLWDDPTMFKRVHFRATSDAVYRMLVREIQLYPRYFTVERWSFETGSTAAELVKPARSGRYRSRG